MKPARNRPGAWPLTWALLLCVGAPCAALAAPRLEADRPQVHVELNGPLRLAGTMPLGLDALPAGRYRLNVNGPGLPSSVGRLTRSYDGRLSAGRMSGPLALLLPPGYLHLEQGEGARAVAMAGVAAAIGVGVLFEEIDRGKALDDLALAERDYARAVSPSEFLTARLNAAEARTHVVHAREVRDIWGAALGYLWAGAALETWLLTPSPKLADRGAGSYAVQTGEASGGAALLRSLLFPGGGQRYLGHAGRGALFLGALGGAGAFTIAAHDGYLAAHRAEERARAALDAATDPQQVSLLRVEQKQASERKRDRNRLRWAGLTAVAGLYFWNVLDARGLATEHAAPGGLSLSLEPAGDGLTGALTWRLP